MIDQLCSLVRTKGGRMGRILSSCYLKNLPLTGRRRVLLGMPLELL